MPVVKPPVRKIGNFLIDIFASSPSLFEAVSSDPANQPAVKQMNAIIEENSKTSKWPREMVLFLKDLPKYNYGGIECEWRETAVNTIGNSADVVTAASTVQVATRAGNVLQRLDPYNTFYDTTIPVSRVSDEGDFIGYISQYSTTRLYKYIADRKITLGVTKFMNEDKLFSSSLSNGTSKYQRPKINTILSGKEEPTAMETLFHSYGGSLNLSIGGAKDKLNPIGINEITILYLRIVPKIFKIKVPDDNSVQIWKFTVLNWNTLIIAEKLANAHGIFPALLCQIDEEGIDDQVKSAAELLIPMQNLQTKYYDARMQGLKRNVNDRALYNSSRIDKKHINDDNPSSKIPVKPNILNPGLDNAYRQIPFQDNLGVTMQQEIGFLNQIATRISGLNDPQQGMFQKGNKTLGEFNEIMANADDDLRTWAKLVETQAISPLKYIIKVNILQFQSSTTVSGNGNNPSVEVDPLALRKAAVDFKLADGLLTKEALLDLPTARGFFELLLQSPQLQAYYGEKLPELVDYIFTSVGFDTSKFKGTTAPAALAPPQEGAPPNAQPPA